jgi:UDP-N-acetylglucosamine 2-epimerase (non-hydrolysing)
MTALIIDEQDAVGPANGLPVGSVAVVFGTRPEAIKLAPLVKALGPAACVVHTGQHYDANMGSDVLADVGISRVAVALGVGGSSRGRQIGDATSKLDAQFCLHRPAVVVVQGDTNATVAGALAANARDIPLVHVEAGLRSHDRRMPEEHNRILVDHLADLCCAPTSVNAVHLAAEGIAAERIDVTGNTIIEAVEALVPDGNRRRQVLERFGLDGNTFVLATIHRPENVDDIVPLAAILQALADMPVPVVLPLHPRTRARILASRLDGLLDHVHVTPPLGPVDFLALAAAAVLWISDSGGLQEEASVLKKPVLVVRRSTERPEVHGIFAELVPAGPAITERARAWLDDPRRRARLADLPSPYGDGTASARIASEIVRRFT